MLSVKQNKVEVNRYYNHIKHLVDANDDFKSNYSIQQRQRCQLQEAKDDAKDLDG